MSSGPTSDELPLGAEFPATTREQWLDLVRKALKDRPYERLVARTYDDIAIEPLYPRARGAAPLAMRSGPWQISQRIELPNAEAANRELLHELNNGANALTLVLPGAVGDRGFALDAAALDRALAGVMWDAGVAIDLDLSPQTKNAPAQLAALVCRQGIDPKTVHLRSGFDPLGAMARAGGTPMPWNALLPVLTDAVGVLTEQGFAGPHLPADGRVVHDAGGSEAQELAYVMGVAVAYLRALESRGWTLDAARRCLYVRLSADADQFLTTAKFRALRKLWAHIEQSCGLTPAPLFVAAETGWRMMSRRDPWVNILRTAIATFAAGIGGADSITALPFTTALGLPDRFARRIARNTHLLLLEESHVAKVCDPAAGAGGIEHLTDQLCVKAWSLFQDIERAGGAYEALANGSIQREVARVQKQRQANVAHRRDSLTGASDYPLLTEADVAVLSRDFQTARPYPATISFPVLAPSRLTEPFEALRDASDEALARNGARPSVFFANLGRLSDFTARQTFARSFFETAGIEGVTNDGFANRDEMIAAFKASGAKLACLCSSDALYEIEAADAARALAQAGAIHIYLAGRPKDAEPYKAAGIGTFIYVGCDVLATLRTAQGMIL